MLGQQLPAINLNLFHFCAEHVVLDAIAEDKNLTVADDLHGLGVNIDVVNRLPAKSTAAKREKIFFMN